MIIKIENLYKSFGKNQVLKGVNLDIANGGIFAILGPNGSGKTTLIKSILGMVLPDTGVISVENCPVKNNWKYRWEIDYLPQIANFPSNLTVRELITMIKDLRGMLGDDQTLISCFRLEPFLDKKTSSLSGGTRQKVNLLLTFMFDSPILILDEPTTGLDPIALLGLKELIRHKRACGKTILVTSHIMNFVEEIADQIVFILEGQVYFKGNISSLKTRTCQDNFEYAIATLLKESHV